MFFVFFVFSLIAFSQSTTPKNEEEQKKFAEKLFESEDYGQAYRYYSTLLANYPKDPKYNYRMGVCILYSGDERGDRKKSIPYLEFAKNKMEDLDKEVLFYLAKAYHVNYRFDEAIKSYNAYKAVAGSGNLKRLKVDREIQSAQNGKKLLSRIRELMVMDKKRLNSSDYFRSYEQSFYGGNLLVRPDDFRLPGDMKKKDKVILFQSKDKSTIVFSSYGESGENGKDLYMAKRGENGEFSKPFPVPGKINTEFDEDYPYLHPNGKHLFFCSKGHNSMGGYDIFKSEWNEAKQQWSTPINLDFPVNTPYDDIQFVTDSSEKLAIFSSNRISETGKIDVYKVSMERRPSEFSYMSGEVIQEVAGKSKMSKIMVKDIASGDNIGTFSASADGRYSLQLPNGGRFILTVETPGFLTQSKEVQIPLSYDLRPYRQIITYENEKLVIKNFFDANEDETAYERMRELLEEKMKMNVNTDLFQDNPPLELFPTDNLSKDSVNKPSKENPIARDNKQYSNKEMLEIAKNDLSDTEKEWAEIKTQSENAAALLVNIKEALSVRDAELVQLEKEISAETREKEKQKLMAELQEKKQETERLREAVNTAQNYSSSLKVQFMNKDKEKQLEEKLVKAMNDVVNLPKNKEKEKFLLQAETDLLEHQKVINQSQEEDLLTTSKTQIEATETELKKLVSEKNTARNELVRIENEIKDKEEELKNEKDKDLIENLNAELSVLKEERVEVVRKNETIDTRISNAEKELDNAVSQSNFVEGMMLQSKTGKTDVTALLETKTDKQEELEKEKNVVLENSELINQKSSDSNSLISWDERRFTLKQNIEQISMTNNDTALLNKKIILVEDYISALEGKLGETKDSIRLVSSGKDKRRLEKQRDGILTEKNKFVQLKNDLKITSDSIQVAALASNPLNNAEGPPSDSLNIRDSIVANNSTLMENTGNPVSNSKDSFAIRQNKLVQIISGNEGESVTTELFDQKIKAISDYNLLIDSRITSNKEVIKSTKEKEIKRKLESENADLVKIKKENNKRLTDLRKEKQNLEKSNVAVLANNTEVKKTITNSSVQSKADTALVRSIQLQLEAFEQVPYSNEKARAMVERSREKYSSVIDGYSVSAGILSSSERYAEKDEINKKTQDADSIIESSLKIQKDITIKEKQLENASYQNKVFLERSRDSLVMLKNQKELDAFNLRHEASSLQSLAGRKVIFSLDSLNSTERIPREIRSVDSLISSTEKKLLELDKFISSQSDVSKKTDLMRKRDSTDQYLLSLQHQATIMRIAENPEIISLLSENLPENKSLNDNARDTEKKQHLVLQDLIAANQAEFSALERRSTESKTQSQEKNNPDAKQLNINARKQIQETQQAVKKAEAEKDLFKKTKALKRILEGQQAALLQQKKALVIYDGGDPDTVVLFRKPGEKQITTNNLSDIKDSMDSPLNPTASTTDTSLVSRISSTKDSILSPVVSDSLNKAVVQTKTQENVKSDTAVPSKSDSTNFKSEIKPSSNDVVVSNEKKSVADSIPNSIPNNNPAATSVISKKDTVINNQVSVSSSTVNRLPQNSSTALVNSSENAFSTNSNLTSVNQNQRSGFTVKSENSYSDANPIPIDNKFPEGLIFTVQIGAFRSAIPNSSFKGLSPVYGTRTSSGFIRYQAGIFYELAEAKKARDEMRSLGFRDAFVAVYKNNQRVSLAEAMRDSGIKDSVLVSSVVNSQIIPAINNSAAPRDTSLNANVSIASTDVNSIGGLFFTVQIGVFGPNVNVTQTLNLRPLNRNAFTANSYRYSAGIYADIDRVKLDRNRVKDLGIGDAFVTAYYKGERISVAEALRRSSDGSARFETEQPIIFPGEISPSLQSIVKTDSVPAKTELIQPFTNSVTTDPVPTSENGVKLTNEGIVYKIQIGAFSRAVPSAITSTWMKIQTWPVRNYTNANGLIIYTVGSFSEFSKAGQLLNEMLNTGIRDAFITVFKDGKRLYGAEAAAYLR